MAITEERFEELWVRWLKLGQKGLNMNHFELAKALADIEDDPETWREFLEDDGIQDYIEKNIRIIRSAELNKMIDGVAGSKSVGQAQLINALEKQKGDTKIKEGPIFVYMYVPLNPEQRQAENIAELDKDPFIKQKEDEPSET